MFIVWRALRDEAGRTLRSGGFKKPEGEWGLDGIAGALD
jgi:hypothetical protein